MNFLHHHQTNEALAVGGFCALVGAVFLAIVIANLNLF